MIHFHSRKRSLWRGTLAGATGGLAASWVMNLFFAGLAKAQQKMEVAKGGRPEGGGPTEEQEEDSTEKTADGIAYALTNEHLTREEKKKAGPMVHYAFGGLMGGVYGAIAECSVPARMGAGTLFGAALFVGADEIMVPALGLGKSPTEQPLSSQASHLAAHLIYGATVELVRRGLRSRWS